MVISNMEHFNYGLTIQKSLSSSSSEEKTISMSTMSTAAAGKKNTTVTSTSTTAYDGDDDEGTSQLPPPPPQLPPAAVAAPEAGEKSSTVTSATTQVQVPQILRDDADSPPLLPERKNNNNNNVTLQSQTTPPPTTTTPKQPGTAEEAAGTSTPFVQGLHDAPQSPSPPQPSLVQNDNNKKNDDNDQSSHKSDVDSNGNKSDNSSKNPFQRIILMGQFNYVKSDFDINVLQRWIQKFTPIFGKVFIRGEFWNITQLEQIRTAIPGIEIEPPDSTYTKPNKYGKYTGFYTPMSNLKHALLEYQQYFPDLYDGILYMHDDSIPNLQVLAGLQEKEEDAADVVDNNYHRDIGGNLQSEHGRKYGIVGTTLGTMNYIQKNDYSYINPRDVLRKKMLTNKSNAEEVQDDDDNNDNLEGKYKYLLRKSYRIYATTTTTNSNNNTDAGKSSENDTTSLLQQLPFATIDGTYKTQTIQELHKNKLDNWNQRPLRTCMGGQYNMVQSISTNSTLQQKYFEYYDYDNFNNNDANNNTNNPFMIFPAYTQSDLLYMPFTYTSTFVELATLLEQHNVWIECAIPTIVDQIQRIHGVGVSAGAGISTTDQGRNYHVSVPVEVNVIPLCTSWKSSRGKSYMALVCANATNPYYHGVYHPIKPGVDINGWEKVFDRINDKYLQSIGIS